MPNIQIHGYFFSIGRGGLVQVEFENKLMKLMDTIEQVIEELGLGDDSVMELVTSHVYTANAKRSRMPYLQVCDTNKQRLKRIVRALKKANIGMDTEELLLSGFTEGAKMKAKGR